MNLSIPYNFLLSFIKNNFYKFVRYFVVGINLLLFNLITLYFLNKFLNPYISVTITYVFSAALHFLLNKYYTFKNDTVIELKSILYYLFLLLYNYLFTLCVTYFFIEVWNLSVYLAMVTSYLILPLMNFIYMKIILFKTYNS